LKDISNILLTLFKENEKVFLLHYIYLISFSYLIASIENLSNEMFDYIDGCDINECEAYFKSVFLISHKCKLLL
jgi:hypothetical protein